MLPFKKSKVYRKLNEGQSANIKKPVVKKKKDQMTEIMKLVNKNKKNNEELLDLSDEESQMNKPE